MIPLEGEKALGSGFKPKFKAQEPVSKKAKNRKLSPIWKQVAVNPFGPTFEKGIKLNSLDNLDFSLAEVREFRAGGSMSPSAKLSGHSTVNENQDTSGKVIWSEQEMEMPMREEVEKVGMETNLDPNPPTPPSMENSNHPTQDGGSRVPIK